MKSKFNYLRFLLTPSLLLLLANAVVAQSPKMPFLLMQTLQQSPNYIEVRGVHEVEVAVDTADFVAVTVFSSVGEIDDLAFPDDKIVTAGSSLTVTSDFPFRKLTVHTSTQSLAIVTKDDSKVILSSFVADTVALDWVRLEARDYSDIEVLSPIVCHEAFCHGYDEASLRYGYLKSDKVSRFAAGESRVRQRGVDDVEPPFLYNMILDHRSNPIFFHLSYGCGGWSSLPMGGMNRRIDDYFNGSTFAGFYSVAFGGNFYSTKHWDFGVGFGTMVNSVMVDNVLLGVTTDPSTGSSHIGIVAEPVYAHNNNGQRLWRTTFSSVYLQVPIRMEWHHRLDYKGVRLSAEIIPSISMHDKNQYILKQGIWVSGVDDENEKRIELLRDTVGPMLNRFSCDFRFDIGWNNVSFFVQTSLVPVFRTSPRKDEPYLDRRIFNVASGISFNF